MGDENIFRSESTFTDRSVPKQNFENIFGWVCRELNLRQNESRINILASLWQTVKSFEMKTLSNSSVRTGGARESIFRTTVLI